jgi:hypothetical protein
MTDDMAVTASKVLKTLSFRDGRVSIEPEEVLCQLGYVEARRHATNLVRNPTCSGRTFVSTPSWRLTDCGALAVRIASSHRQSRASGISYLQALAELEAFICVRNL